MSDPTKTKGVYMPSDARWSKAYKKLTPAARDILRLAMEKRTFKGKKCTNNGEIIITHTWVQKKLESSKKTVSDGFRLLIGVGFLEVTKKAEGKEGNRYRVCISDGYERWREYPERNWFPEKSKTDIGIDSRWKKGESGRKKNITL